MSILFNLLFSAVPVIFLVGSVVLAVKAVSRGKSRKRTLLMQLASFAAVFALCVIFPIVANRRRRSCRKRCSRGYRRNKRGSQGVR